MATAAEVRKQVEEALADKGGARLGLSPRLTCEGYDTGYSTLDALLQGGFPVAGTTEIVGSRSSGRASIASAYVARRTQEGHVCAWVDVSGDMSPEAMLANGLDTERLLVVRCGGDVAEPEPVALSPMAGIYLKGKARRDKAIGTPGMRNRPLGGERVEQVNSDRQPARRGGALLKAAEERAVPRPALEVKRTQRFVQAKKPWTRLEQAMQAVDLLVQGGGFAAIVLDLGAIAPQYARRIPQATWFRWRAALERTRTSLVVLSQMGLAGSAAELALRVEAEMPAPGKVLLGVRYRLEVVRRRFAEDAAQGRRKGPERANTSTWETRAVWA